MGTSKLDNYRKDIDKIDSEIIGLLAKRFDTVKKIGEYKEKLGLPVYQSRRWLEVMNRAVEQGKNVGLSSKFVQHIWKIIHNHALHIQYHK